MKRAQQKLKTHRSLLAASIKLLSSVGSFSAISLREVTKAAGIVPAAFYRHFANMDELGIELVEYSFKPLRRMLREIRQKPTGSSRLLVASIDAYLAYVRNHRKFFIFLVRERSGGLPTVRSAIREQLNDIARELAEDLAEIKYFKSLNEYELHMVASSVVDSMVVATDKALDLPPGDSQAEQALFKETNFKLQLIFAGARFLQQNR